MEHLLELKQWVTLEEAARYLTSVMNTAVTVADLLQFGLDGRLKLSVNIVNPIALKTGKLVPRAEAPKAPGLPVVGQPPYEVILGVELNSTEVLVFDGAVQQASSGVFDLPLVGGERIDVEERLQSLIGGPAIETVNVDGTFLRDPRAGTWLQVQLPFRDETDQAPAKKTFGRSPSFYSVGRLPDSCLSLVVRPAAIFDFIDAVRTNPRASPAQAPQEEKPGGPLALFDYWLRHDTWTTDEGHLLLMGLDPRGTTLTTPGAFTDHTARFRRAEFLDRRRSLVLPEHGHHPEAWTEQEKLDFNSLSSLNDKLHEIQSIWESGTHGMRAKPQYYVDWALSKGISIEWLAVARGQGNFTPPAPAVPPSPASSESKPLSTKERNSLLLIIAALCKAADIDFARPAKAAVSIQSQADAMGLSIGESTIEGHLKRVPDAISARGK